MSVETPRTLKPKESRIIGTVLSPALRLWLRSQVESVEALQFNIGGGDRKILTGHIPTVSVAASQAVYQGLHLSHIQLEATSIRVNLGQVIKGKPLRLLAPIPVIGQLLLTASNLQASLKSPLLATALTELLDTLLTADGTTELANDLKHRQIVWQRIDIDTGHFKLTGTITDSAHQITPLVIHSGLQLITAYTLQLHTIQIQLSPAVPPINLDNFPVDLGSDVEIQELNLTLGQLSCRGRITVIP